METLKDFGMFLIDEIPDIEKKKGTIQLNNVYFENITRTEKDAFTIFGTVIVENSFEYALTLDLNREQLYNFIVQMIPSLPKVAESFKEDFEKDFSGIENYSIENIIILMAVEARLNVDKGIFLDSNGEQFISFIPEFIQIYKVSEILWEL